MTDAIAPNVCLDGSKPAPLIAAEACAATVVPRGKTFHYTGCGCGSRTWLGSLADWVWHRCGDAAVDTLLDGLFGDGGGGGGGGGEAHVSHHGHSGGRPPLSGYSSVKACKPRSWPRVALRISYFIPHHNVYVLDALDGGTACWLCVCVRVCAWYSMGMRRAAARGVERCWRRVYVQCVGLRTRASVQ